MTEGTPAVPTPTGGNGGGIYIGSTGTLEMNGGVIGSETSAGNDALRGGGIYAEGTANITAGIIGKNTATTGGGIYISNGQMQITGSNSSPVKVSGNTASSSGGGIYILTETASSPSAAFTFRISRTEISGNTADSGGGGICIMPSHGAYLTASIEDSTIENNTLSGSGSGISGGAGIAFSGGYDHNSSLTLARCTISGNDAGSLPGGGIYMQTGSSGFTYGTVTMADGAVISGNTASSGGGVSVHSSAFIMSGSAAVNDGNPVFLDMNTSIQVDDNSFTGSAKISLPSYTAGTIVITGAAVPAVYTYFTLSDPAWNINSAGQLTAAP